MAESPTHKLGQMIDDLLQPRAFARYDIEVRYTNGDTIRATFKEKDRAVRFLRDLVAFPAGAADPLAQ